MPVISHTTITGGLTWRLSMRIRIHCSRSLRGDLRSWINCLPIGCFQLLLLSFYLWLSSSFFGGMECLIRTQEIEFRDIAPELPLCSPNGRNSKHLILIGLNVPTICSKIPCWKASGIYMRYQGGWKWDWIMLNPWISSHCSFGCPSRLICINPSSFMCRLMVG